MGYNVALHDLHLFGAGPVCLLPRRQGHCSGAVIWGCLCSVSGQRQQGRCAGGETLCGLRGSPSRTVCQVCLLSGLADMGLHHCRLVAGWMVESSVHSYSLPPTAWWGRAACVYNQSINQSTFVNRHKSRVESEAKRFNWLAPVH